MAILLRIYTITITILNGNAVTNHNMNTYTNINSERIMGHPTLRTSSGLLSEVSLRWQPALQCRDTAHCSRLSLGLGFRVLGVLGLV